MPNGFLIVVRNLSDSGIIVEAVEDWEDFMDEQPRRLIYCQAISNLEAVVIEVKKWKEDFSAQTTDVNDIIAEIVSSIQWIGNDYPLRSFRNLD